MTLTIKGTSMSGIVEQGEDIEVETEDFQIQRNDLVIFNECGSIPSIKRCVGIPGDEINLIVDHLYINKISLCTTNFKPLLLDSTAQIHCWVDWLKFIKNKIPKDFFFVVGNVLNCIDSRKRGFILNEQIIGRVKK